MAMGRPSEYEESFPDKVLEYLNDPEETYPTRAGLALFLHCTKQTLINWGERHPDFLDALEDLDRQQEKKLWNKGLDGTWNSNIVKLGLHNHGYSDRTDVTSGNEALKPGVINVVNPKTSSE